MIHSLEFNDETPIINGEEAVLLTDAKESPTGESGGVRDVYLTSKFVFKYGNAREAELFIEPEDRQHFTKTLVADIDMNWVIQERLDCTPRLCSKKEFQVVQKMCKKYGIEDISWTASKWVSNGVTRNTHNWTVDNNGIPVIFDYAND